MVDLAVKITALLGAAWVVAFLLRGRAASARHAVWIGLMIAALALPALAAFVPRVELAWLPSAQAAVASPSPVSASFDAAPAAGTAAAPAATATPRPSAVTKAALLSSISLAQLLAAAWAAIALLLIARVVRAHARARRLLATCEAPSPALISSLEAASAELGIAAPPLRVARAGTMPAVIGITRPSVVLPADAATWTAERLRVVLLHECAHVRRRDAMLQLVSSVATAAYWWHPLAWLAANRVARERELACDDLVIASGTPGSEYAGHLLDIARSLRTSREPAMAALAMARTSELEGRLISLLEERPRSTRPARALALGVVLALVAVSIIAPLKIVARDAAILPQAIESASVTPRPESRGIIVTGAELDVPYTQATEPPAGTAAGEIVQAAPARPVDTAMADVLLAAAKDEDPDIRMVALSALSRSGDARGVPLMLDALKDESEDVRTLALLQLIHMERPEVLSQLSRFLSDESADVRRAAVMGLARLDHPEKTALLIKAASDSSEDVRTMAALGLGRIEGDGVDEMLVTLASDASADVRRAALIAIASRTRGGDDDLVTQLGTGIGAGIGAGIGNGIAGGVAGGITAGIAGALDARFGPRPRKQ